MNTQQANRLLNVARACRESEHADKFTMTKFTYSCGTPGCALGNYAGRGDLQKVFSIRWSDDLQALDLFFRDRETVENSVEIQNYFGVSKSEAWRMFSLSGCNNAQTPEAAADYIEQFVRDKGFDVVEVEA